MSETGNALAERPAKPVDQVRHALERMKPQLAMALPKHLTADRLLRVAMTAVQTTPKLLDCDRTSLYRAVMTCAQLGLEPDGVLGQAYLVPFAGKVQFIPGYRGLISLARNSGEVSSIAAHEVCENDDFSFDFASGDPPKHTFDIRKERGDIIAVYAVVRFKDGAFHWDMMTRAEVDTIRNRSQGWQTAVRYNKQADSPWGAHYTEMAKKTAIRRIVKYLPLSVQKAAALADSYDTGRHTTIDGHGDLVIEAEAPSEADAPAMAHQATQLERFEQTHGAAHEADPVNDIYAPPPGAKSPSPDYDPETGEVYEAGVTDSAIRDIGRPDPAWLAEFNSLAPRPADLGSDEVDWETYVQAAGYLISKASPADLAALEVSRNPHLVRLRSEDPDRYRSVIGAIKARTRAA
jgi:recombination protein RecT